VLFWIFAAVSLYAVQVFLPSMFRLPQIGVARYLGSRDDLPPLPTYGNRAMRAVDYMKESMPVFLAFAVLAIVLGKEAGLAILGAQMFVVARAAFAVIYLLAVPVLRSVAYLTGFAGLVVMAFGLV